MLYKKEPYNMLVLAIMIYGFIFSIIYGVMQGADFYDDNEL